MNRQRIRMIALAALVVAAGGYVWAQRAASTVKPAPTATAAVKKPGAVVPPAKTAAPPANAKPGAAASGAATAAASVPASKAPVAAPAAAAVPAKTAAAVPPTAAPASAPVAKAAASTPAVSARPEAMAVPVAAPMAAAPIVPASWHDQLQKGAYLTERLRARLPEGTEPLAAANGFRDLQQFVATATAAHNLKLDFEELKRRVVTDRKGLAPAIDAMKKVASATIEEQRAEYEARGLIQEAQRHPVPPPPAAKASTPKQGAKKPARVQSGV